MHRVLHAVRRGPYHLKAVFALSDPLAVAELLQAPLATTEFLALDTETNGLGGDACELTEIGAVLVGGGELHDRFSSLVQCSAPLRRGIQRLTGITQAMVDTAPPLEQVLPSIGELMAGRVLVAHNAPFDQRVLRQAFDRIGLPWPDPPVICTAALARTLLPLQHKRGLGVLADALGIEVEVAHRALADAETCGRVLCALFPRLCAHAATVADALQVLAPRRRARKGGSDGASASRLGRDGTRRGARWAGADSRGRELDFSRLPRDPGVYIFRDDRGQVLYVGKSVSIRSRARAHFAPSAPAEAWTAYARVVDHQATVSELGALVLENRLIKEHRPPGNTRLIRADDRLVYIRCRLDIPFPVLEVAPDPAAGHAVSIGPVRGRSLAAELVEQLDSLFGLRHCGRRLTRRDHPSAYGQMGRCLSPCLGDLDPNLYRRRLDAALSLFSGADGATALLRHISGQMQQAADRRQFERAAALQRRRGRLATVLHRLGGVLEATHARPRLVLAPHPADPGRAEAFWLAGGRLVDHGALPGGDDELVARTEAAVARGGPAVAVGAHVPPGEVDEVRIVGSWLASHPDTPQLTLAGQTTPSQIVAFARAAAARPAGRRVEPGLRRVGRERELDDDALDGVVADVNV
jgi:DNA polymerase-3 subunit epsilon